MLNPQSPESRIPARVLVPLAVLAAIAPFATDLYLPSFPSMVSELSTTEAGVQLSLTAFLIGAGLGQVLFGPLSDRFGRTRPLFAGLTISVLASVAAALAPSIEFLIVVRLVQGMTAAVGMVIGRAMISDLADGKEAARALSMMMVIGGVAPVIAPIVGALLAEPIGWRGLLWIVAALCAVALTLALLFLRETHSVRTASERAAERAGERVGIRHLATRGYLGNTLAFAFAFATMMAYISASPFLYQDLMGLDTLQYGIAFGVNALALMLVSGLTAKLTATVPVARLAAIGLGINAAAIVVIVLLVLAGAPAIWLAAPILVAVAAIGLVLGPASALALGHVREASGTGSAILGLLQFSLAGATAPFVSLGGGTSALPLALTMLVATVIANVAFRVARSGNASRRAAMP